MKYYSWEGIYHYTEREYFWQYDLYGYERLFHKDASRTEHKKGKDYAVSEEDLRKKLNARYIELKWCGEIQPFKLNKIIWLILIIISFSVGALIF